MSALSDSFVTHHVTDGQAAIDFCAESLPDIILMDINMKPINGLDACRVLKNDTATSHIPIIFMTADVNPTTEDQCWDAGANDFINKPYSIKTLRNRVNSHLSVKLLTDKLKELVTIDGMTNILNRRYLDYYLDEQMRLASRNKASLGFLLIDIDYFKNFNDTFGHLRGDEVLKIVAKSLQSSLSRPSDAVARFGGEEFAIVLPDTQHDGLVHVAKRILNNIEELAILHPASPFEKLTVSIGGSMFEDKQLDQLQLIEKADNNLYKAKANGRNQIKT